MSCIEHGRWRIRHGTNVRLLRPVDRLCLRWLPSASVIVGLSQISSSEVHTASSPPRRLTVSSTILSTSTSEETSPGMRMVLPPLCDARVATSSSCSRELGRSFNATSKPSLASFSTIAFPIPEAAPVTMATRRAAAISTPFPMVLTGA